MHSPARQYISIAAVVVPAHPPQLHHIVRNVSLMCVMDLLLFVVLTCKLNKLTLLFIRNANTKLPGKIIAFYVCMFSRGNIAVTPY